MDQDTKKIIFEGVKIGYKRGFLDGMNFEKAANGLEEMSREEFDELQISKIIEIECKKVWKKFVEKYSTLFSSWGK